MVFSSASTTSSPSSSNTLAVMSAIVGTATAWYLYTGYMNDSKTPTGKSPPDVDATPLTLTLTLTRSFVPTPLLSRL